MIMLKSNRSFSLASVPRIVLNLIDSNAFNHKPEIIRVNFDYSRLFFQTLVPYELQNLIKELINNYSHLANEDQHLLFAGYTVIRIDKSDLHNIKEFEKEYGCIRDISSNISVFDFSNLKLSLKETR